MSKQEFLQKEARIEYANLIYSLYPRKEGKASGMKKLMSMLNTVDDYNKISKATINYAAKVKREQRELQFVLLFATFINGRWQDYTDENLGQQQSQADNTKWF